MPTKAVNSASSIEEERWKIPQYRTGCDLHPDCLECPMSLCAEDFSEGAGRNESVTPAAMWSSIAYDLNNGIPVPGAHRFIRRGKGQLFKLNATGRRLLGVPLRTKGEDSRLYANRLVDFGASVAEAAHIAGIDEAQYTHWRKKNARTSLAVIN